MNIQEVQSLLQIELLTREHPTMKPIRDKVLSQLADIVAELTPKPEPETPKVEEPKAIPATEATTTAATQTAAPTEERKA